MKSCGFAGGVVLASLALAAAGACGGASSNNPAPGDGGGLDASASDGGFDREAAAHDAAGHDAAVAEAGPDAGTEDAAADQGGPDAPLCAAPATKQGAACDTCITANCESLWCACRNDTDSVDDAGVSGCLRYVACAEQCVAADAGTPTDCFKNVCATTAYTSAEQKEGQTFVGCLVQYCASECGP